jgi:DNA-binding MarR family transcriptional regulator
MTHKDWIQNLSDGNKKEDLYLWLLRSRDLVFQVREKELRKYDLTPEQSAILFFVRVFKEQAGPAELSRAVFRKRHTVSTIVDRMIKKGLLKKTPDLEYKNRLNISLTNKGEEYYKLSRNRSQTIEISDALTEKECQRLIRYLDRISLKAEETLGIDRKRLNSSK